MLQSNPMLVSAYHKMKARMERLKDRYDDGKISAFRYKVSMAGMRVVTQLIVTPRFLLLGPFKTFTAFARKDEHGSWIDSYNEFIISNRITVAGIVALVLIGVVTILVFIYLPILYI